MKKTPEDHLKIIQFLLAALILKKEMSLKQVAKVMGCSDKTLTAMFSEKK